MDWLNMKKQKKKKHYTKNNIWQVTLVRCPLTCKCCRCEDEERSCSGRVWGHACSRCWNSCQSSLSCSRSGQALCLSSSPPTSACSSPQLKRDGHNMFIIIPQITFPVMKTYNKTSTGDAHSCFGCETRPFAPFLVSWRLEECYLCRPCPPVEVSPPYAG